MSSAADGVEVESELPEKVGSVRCFLLGRVCVGCESCEGGAGV